MAGKEEAKRNTVIFSTYTGSRLYGVNLPTSDTDIKSIVLPPARDILLGEVKDRLSLSQEKGKGVRNTHEDTDDEHISLALFVRELLLAKPGSVEMVFAPPEMHQAGTSSAGLAVIEALRQNASKWLGADGVEKSFSGMAVQQTTVYKQKSAKIKTLRCLSAFADDPAIVRQPLSTIRTELIALVQEVGDANVLDLVLEAPKGGDVETDVLYIHKRSKLALASNSIGALAAKADHMLSQYSARSLEASAKDGTDWKCLSHAIRVLTEATELLETGHLTLPLQPEAREMVLRIKKGEATAEEALKAIDKATKRLEDVRQHTVLPRTVDRAWIEGLVVRTYARHLMENQETGELFRCAHEAA